MTDDTDPSPESEPGHGELPFSHPDIERVDRIGDVIRVRLRSGIELEWPVESLEPPTHREPGQS